MRLKKLSLSGFKSFPNRTVIEFVSGISAVVGPNGCGKSNIADAVRWALGEQSPAKIRAKSMDDVLFRGGDGRQAAFSEVSLILDNNAGMAPPELAELPEIEVKRILYRSGDTKYQLNGKNCRLKDVHYLFMDTGAGTRAYSIIDQGQIGQYVEMSAAQRRLIVEEAAGISRFKARREDARRRMRLTKENLARLDDLLLEIGKQKKSLERQAAKARRFKEMRQRLEYSESLVFRKKWDESRNKLLLLRNKDNELKRMIISINSSNSAERMRLEAAVIEESDAADSLSSVESAVSQSEDRLKVFKNEYDKLEKKRILSESRLQEFRARGSDLEERIRDIKARKDVALNEVDELSKKLQEIEKEVRFARQGVKEVKGYVDNLRAEVESVKGEIVDVAASLARHRSEKNNLEERINRLSKKIKAGEDEREGVDDRITILREEEVELQTDLAMAGDVLEKLETEVLGLEEGINRSAELLDAARKNRSEVEASKVNVEARLSALQSIENSDQLRSEKAMKILKNRGYLCGILSDFIDVDLGAEKIFEGLFGPFLDALIIPNIPEAVEGVIDVSVNRRIAVLKADCKMECRGMEAAERPCKGQENWEKGSDSASLFSKIKVSSSISNSVKRFISKTAVCSDLLTGLSMVGADDFSLPYFTVTEQGDLINFWGGFVTGSSGKGSGGVLVRRGEIKRLTMELKKTEERLLSVRRDEEDLDSKLALLKTSLSTAVNSRKVCNEKVKKIQKSIDRIEPEIDSLDSRKSLLDFEISDWKDELDGATDGLKKSVSSLADAESRDREIHASLQGRKQALKVQEKTLGARHGKLRELETEAAVCSNSLSERKKEIDRINKSLSLLENEILSREEGEVKLVSNLEMVIEELRLAGAKVEAQKKAYGDATDKAKEKKYTLERHRSRVASIRDKTVSIVEELRGKERKKHALELEISEQENSATLLSRALFEKYRKDIDEIQIPQEFSGDIDLTDIEKEISLLADKIEKIGPVNLAAVDEFREASERLSYLEDQKRDLLDSMADLEQAIERISAKCNNRFSKSLKEINQSLGRTFPLLFEGGSAILELEKDKKNLEEESGNEPGERDLGIDFLVQIPGKKIQHLNLLSGGEKTMAAIALIFALYFIRPSPFCLLDEVDAPLDEANTLRFNRLLEEISDISQVILITHNQKVMEIADTLYGVTMEQKGVSKLVSVDMAHK